MPMSRPCDLSLSVTKLTEHEAFETLDDLKRVVAALDEPINNILELRAQLKTLLTRAEKSVF